MSNQFTPYGRQDISEEDIAAVVEVLRSDFLTQGPKVPEFEQVVADYCGVKCGVATNSATSALHIACLALGLGHGDWLWTSPITFVASANCGLYCGAKVDFVDIDPDTLNMCPHELENKLISAEKEGKLPKVVIPVHFGGASCDMEKIFKLGQKYGFKIIEDASHAIGGRYKSFKVGSCKYSDITVFSFHPVKIITSGEGGMAVTNNDSYAQRMKLLRSHGVTRNDDLMEWESEGPWYYQQVTLGFNYRMTDIHAALGISQMKKIDEFVEKRNKLVQQYHISLKGLPLTCQLLPLSVYSAYHLFVVKCSSFSKRRELFNHLRKNNIGVNVHYIPIHLQPYYKSLGFKKGDFPNSEAYYDLAISLPLYPGLNCVMEITDLINEVTL